MIIRIKEPEYPFETNSYKQFGGITGGLIDNLEELVNFIFPGNNQYETESNYNSKGVYDVEIIGIESFIRFIRNKEYKLIRTDEGVDSQIIWDKDDFVCILGLLPKEIANQFIAECLGYNKINDFFFNHNTDKDLVEYYLPNLIDLYIEQTGERYYKIEENRLKELLKKELAYDQCCFKDFGDGYYLIDYNVSDEEINNELAKYK